ncbi:MAG: hypothetical protein LBJ81_00810 [Puniceicoccales bacterium]|nr:hypothetical protein [Puniceicoccales bacterium]
MIEKNDSSLRKTMRSSVHFTFSVKKSSVGYIGKFLENSSFGAEIFVRIDEISKRDVLPAHCI